MLIIATDKFEIDLDSCVSTKVIKGVLYAQGCSYAFGQELVAHENDRNTVSWYDQNFNDKTGPDNNKYRLENSYPTLLARRLGIELVVNDAYCGGSNRRIARRTFEYVTKYLAAGHDPKNLLVSVGWTDACRTEFWYEKHGKWVQFLLNGIHAHHTEHELQDLWRLFVVYFHSIPTQLQEYVQHVLTLQTFLKSVKVPYIFHRAMFDTWADKREWRADYGVIENLIDKERYVLFDFLPGTDVASFSTYVNRQGHPPGKFHHPLETGHASWANYLASQVIEKNLCQC